MSTICLFCLKRASTSGDNQAYPIHQLVELMMSTTPTAEFDGPNLQPLCSPCGAIILEITQIQTQIGQLQTAIGRRVLLLRRKIGDSESSFANCPDNKEELVEEEAKLRPIRKVLLDLQDNTARDAHVDVEVKVESVDYMQDEEECLTEHGVEFADVKRESDPVSWSQPDLRGFSPPSRKRSGSPPPSSSTKRNKITPPATSANSINSYSNSGSDSDDTHPNLDPLGGLDEEEQEIHHSSHLPTTNWIIQSQNELDSAKNTQFHEERDPLSLDPTATSESESPICELCNQSFHPEGALGIHRMVEHENPTVHQPFPCPTSGCGRRFTQETNLARHVRLHELDAERPFFCSVCDSRFPDPASLSRHEKGGLAIHTQLQLSFCCDPCVKGFKSMRGLKLHNLHVHKSGERSTKMALNSDKSQDHTHITRNETVTATTTTNNTVVDTRKRSRKSIVASFPCQLCGRAFESLLGLRVHKGNPPAECDLCATKCFGSGCLQSHQIETHFTCHECGVRTRNQSDFAHHKKTHSLVPVTNKVQKQDEDKEARDCHLCGKVFPSHTGLKLHLGKLRAECEFCGEKFCVAKGLKDHTAEKHTTCDECGYKVRDVKYLALHKAAHSVPDDHPVNKFNVRTDAPTTSTTTTRAPIVKKKICCDFCFATFVSGGGKELHMVTKHPWNGVKTAGNPNSCRICGQDFQSQLSLRIHQQGGGPLMCEICGKSCCGTLALQGHQREKHFTSGESGIKKEIFQSNTTS